MLEHIVRFSLNNKLIVIFFTVSLFAFGVYSLTQIPIGAVPDVTNNQVQVITTSRNLSTQDIEQFITYPIELEMANLPGVQEIRSISKFGLSVVTIVFEDRMGTYLPRQLIAEKIKSASEKIPEGFGSPEMGPISTGLGEIYQYVLEVDEEYKGRYSSMELRTIQDWIVKRQLSGIKGVVEINTWGGFLKRYEVTINPEHLNAMNISPIQVLNAIEKNNDVTGGGYIEKANQSYFIRGEGLVKSLKDIENIVVTIREGSPIYIKDIAEVGYGHATRFGAVTGNGEGEKVLGQVMMLKDANSKAVIEAVKQRVAEVQTTLPPGITINPFLERSELIGKTTFTITENLILGCLIVVFVVVLLLGNFRSGLVVASVIPLALLFAISMMYIFGIDANLMSLGAIDFGIIIDGAVIIVEFIAFKIASSQSQMLGLSKSERKQRIDEITFESTSKMTRSAVFGQLIIIIVFIPILSLTNVEGKMFIPMALTFCFALIGAMILGFTYVPVISSLFIKPEQKESRISRKLISMLESIYVPMLTWVLGRKRLVLVLATLLLSATIVLFTRMGGEFVPTLDEGDFVIQPVLKTGTSLTKTIEITTRIEEIVKRFPEVNQVVTRIGAAEVPTDPMSMEETDVIITLKDRDEWTTAGSKDELANKVKEALVESLPTIDFEFTQPIEMRFNELITGVRSDLAIKIFGEDLDLLYQKAQEVEKLIANVEGAADITVEKVVGLPQLQVKYDRSKIARYGLNISDVNRLVSLGFAGEVAGSIYEGERRFDLSVRFAGDQRKGIENLEQIYVNIPDGGKVPLSSLAEITYTYGPAKISRDNTHRRIVVSINVRNRDLESVVNDVSGLIDNNIDLPPGYYVTYGGQFENLRSARQRLAVAVPISLVLIFILLHFAFKSVRDALMIYSAIPLAAVGGLLLLWIRDMPFSISAGVGFIALFGIAVLNGIVLIEHFKELKAKGITDVKERVIKGATQRLRPVLLTASAAALGFLPMAVSTSAGAEVQRPLATVVVGGLITATLLTLIVLPILYSIFDKGVSIKGKGPKILLILGCFFLPGLGHSQQAISLEEAISIAKENNAGLHSSALEVERTKKLVGTAYSFDRATLYYSEDQNNLTQNNLPLNVWGVQQSFDFPTIYSKQKRILESRVRIADFQYRQEEQLLTQKVSEAYYQVVYSANLVKWYSYLDSVYAKFGVAAKRRFEEGESGYLEQLTAQSLSVAVKKNLDQSHKELELAYVNMYRWIQTGDTITVEQDSLTKVTIQVPDLKTHPGLLQSDESISMMKSDLALQKNQLLPGIQLEYFQGNDGSVGAQTFRGFQVGLSIPILFAGEKSRISAAQVAWEQSMTASDEYEYQLQAKLNSLLADLEKQEAALVSYEVSGRKLSQELMHAANRSFQNGEIDFLQYAQLLERATSIKIDYLQSLWQYNQIALEINHLTFK
ncbi:CusA/CzcA family heavy metal efflux RND transporter [Ekhidna sp.]|uniref:CusA/CzcA family heavy metal efflux RND transporter n=1 Tax=Ekhidna sp. TaxID=2608089 RepID=UPI003B5BB7EE